MEKKSELQWKVDYFRLNRIMKKNRREGKELYYAFVDFDGVLNVFFEPGTPEFAAMAKKVEETGEFDFADAACVARLNRFCDSFPVRMIISSSWRFSGRKVSAPRFSRPCAFSICSCGSSPSGTAGSPSSGRL